MLCMVEVATHNEIMITDDAATLFLFSFTRRTENCRRLRKLLLGDREGGGPAHVMRAPKKARSQEHTSCMDCTDCDGTHCTVLGCPGKHTGV